MFMDIERSYLVARARDCKRRGLTQIEAYDTIQADLRGFSASERIRCAVAAVFRCGGHSAAIF
ncbi:hypothetical protein R5H30_19050 [Sulfitobacter sp. D35]|uniref:hypothetical protein n=1 Tax=Sulfitobacter sp. D35 TaxID=3083252 RepID=UPI00296FF505|nr:hypothetical protein [Sulfitobacter sp. D35]MDW4500092.1 hypothetical protein [Sulfitobacter sp. D35]